MRFCNWRREVIEWEYQTHLDITGFHVTGNNFCEAGHDYPGKKRGVQFIDMEQKQRSCPFVECTEPPLTLLIDSKATFMFTGYITRDHNALMLTRIPAECAKVLNPKR